MALHRAFIVLVASLVALSSLAESGGDQPPSEWPERPPQVEMDAVERLAREVFGGPHRLSFSPADHLLPGFPRTCGRNAWRVMGWEATRQADGGWAMAFYPHSQPPSALIVSSADNRAPLLLSGAESLAAFNSLVQDCEPVIEDDMDAFRHALKAVDLLLPPHSRVVRSPADAEHVLRECIGLLGRGVPPPAEPAWRAWRRHHRVELGEVAPMDVTPNERGFEVRAHVVRGGKLIRWTAQMHGNGTFADIREEPMTTSTCELLPGRAEPDLELPDCREEREGDLVDAAVRAWKASEWDAVSYTYERRAGGWCDQVIHDQLAVHSPCTEWRCWIVEIGEEKRESMFALAHSELELGLLLDGGPDPVGSFGILARTCAITLEDESDAADLLETFIDLVLPMASMQVPDAASAAAAAASQLGVEETRAKHVVERLRKWTVEHESALAAIHAPRARRVDDGFIAEGFAVLGLQIERVRVRFSRTGEPSAFERIPLRRARAGADPGAGHEQAGPAEAGPGP